MWLFKSLTHFCLIHIKCNSKHALQFSQRSSSLLPSYQCISLALPSTTELRPTLLHLSCVLCREDSFSKNLELESVLLKYFFGHCGRKKGEKKPCWILPLKLLHSLPPLSIWRKMYSSLPRLSVIVFVLLYRTSTLNVFFDLFLLLL